MRQAIENAEEELKRVDHLIFVSLKYTRTVDIIKSIIERLISTCDFCIEALLKMPGPGELAEIPKSPGLRTQILRERYNDEQVILDFLDYYHSLRNLSRAEFTRSNEYRRHVTMTAMLKTGPVQINIDNIGDYYRQARVFYTLLKFLEVPGQTKSIPELLEDATTEVNFEKGTH